jgi:hypothetical protein
MLSMRVMVAAGPVTSGGRSWDFPGKALKIRHLCPGVLVAKPGAAGILAPPYSAGMAERLRRARVEDVHQLAMSMPHVTVWPGRPGNPIYQVGGKSFVFFRNPRPDATDPETGERYPDVIMFWVPSESDKQALVQDVRSPFFTTAHFDGHPSVLLRASRIGQLTLQELTEVIQDAWLSQASPRRAAAWLSAQQPGGQDR